MYENRIMKPIKTVKNRRIRIRNRGGGFDQSTSNVCINISQRNQFVQ
jgi:hypothetical protein